MFPDFVRRAASWIRSEMFSISSEGHAVFFYLNPGTHTPSVPLFIYAEGGVSRVCICFLHYVRLRGFLDSSGLSGTPRVSINSEQTNKTNTPSMHPSAKALGRCSPKSEGLIREKNL